MFESSVVNFAEIRYTYSSLVEDGTAAKSKRSADNIGRYRPIMADNIGRFRLFQFLPPDGEKKIRFRPFIDENIFLFSVEKFVDFENFSYLEFFFTPNFFFNKFLFD